MEGSDISRAADAEMLVPELSPEENVLLVASPDDAVDCTDLLFPDSVSALLAVSLVDAPRTSPDAAFERARAADVDRLAAVFVGANGPETATLAERRQDCLESAWIGTESVSNPADLTSVGIAVSEMLDRWGEVGSIGVCVQSLPAWLDHVDASRAFRFFHVLTGRFRRSEAAAHVHADPANLDDRTLATFTQLFDAVLRETGDGWELRQG